MTLRRASEASAIAAFGAHAKPHLRPLFTDGLFLMKSHLFFTPLAGGTTAPVSALDIVSQDASQIQPAPKIAQAPRADFLSGLVTVDDAMTALIDLPNLLNARQDAELAN